MTSRESSLRTSRPALILFLFIGAIASFLPPSSFANGEVTLWAAAAVRGSLCERDWGTEWMIRNNTDSPIDVTLSHYYELKGQGSTSPYRITLGKREVRPLGCNRWYGDNPGQQSFSLGWGTMQPSPHGPAQPPGPTAPVHGPTEPTGFSDDRFRWLGIRQFWRNAAQGGWTEALSVPIILDPGMEVDTDYHQKDERRGPLFHCCDGGATSPLTIDQIPAGFYVEIGGQEYYSAREPAVATKSVGVSMGPFFGGASWDVFQMVLYCGPEWQHGCEVNMKVWVVQRPKRQ
jgi:hypothetical protein